jgi:uncharacterized SAM-binding protein YcdF (DUF218 family)
MLIVQKIVEAFVLPPGFFVTVTLVLGLLWFKSSKGKASLLLLFSLFAYILTTSTGTFLFVRPLEKSFRKEVPQRCDAIIVLGGGVLKGPEGYELRPHAFKRFIQGVELARTYDAFLIVSGGRLPGSSQQPEATIMAELAHRFEVPNEKILIDAESKSTYENAKNVARIVKELNLKELVLVTSAVHMKRAKMSFEKFNVRVHPYPVDYLCDYDPMSWIDFVPTRESLEANMLGLHEIVGLIWYRLKFR